MKVALFVIEDYNDQTRFRDSKQKTADVYTSKQVEV